MSDETATENPTATDTTAAGTPAAPATSLPALEDVEEAMRDVVDPELGINVVDLGLVYGIEVTDEALSIDTISHVGGMSADRRHRGSVARRPGRQRSVYRPRDQLGLAAAVGPGQDHRRRPGAAARARIHRLERCATSIRPPPGRPSPSTRCTTT